MPAQKATRVYTEQYGATVEFEDGHKAHFEGYAHGFAYGLEGLRTIRMWNREKILVFQYNSRLCRSGCDGEHKIVAIKDGYDQQLIAQYWDAARKYLNREYFEKPDGQRDDRLNFPWCVINANGGTDFSRLQKGEAEIIST